MSFNRRVVIWQSESGLWNIAGYDFYYTNNDDEDFDPEWDVEYTDDFNFVSDGHRTQEDADNAWEGANYGGAEIYEHGPENKSYCDVLDLKAKEYLEQQARLIQRHLRQPLSRW